MRISKLTAKRILKDSGANRVSDDASAALADLMTAFSYSVAKKAVMLAEHAKRKTVSKADVELAK
jgi:histone H3/H4